VEGIETMAVKKAAGATKKAAAPKKKAAAPKGAAKKAAAPKKAAAKKAAVKKGTVKKASSAPTKLSSSQTDLLKKIQGAGEPGYRPEKKAEQRTLDSLQEKKLIKRGAKHKESGSYHYQISNTGKKHLEAAAAAGANPGAQPTP
jgi:hypothetical protein